MDDELLAQPQVMKLLDSLREQYTKYQEVCRQRSRRSQLDQIHTKVMQVTFSVSPFFSSTGVWTAADSPPLDSQCIQIREMFFIGF